MIEEPSTLNVTLIAADQEERKDAPLPTSYFLFKEAQGRVVLREPAGKKAAALYRGTVSDTSAPESVEKAGILARSPRVPKMALLRSQPDQRYILLRKYEGFVTARDERSFWARLFENSSDHPVIEAEFDLEELSELDRQRAVEGAPLVWTIGYAYQGGTRKRESMIYLRRLPPWSEKELQKSRQETQALTRDIQWE